MKMNQGTPKTLQEAIRQALQIGPMSDIDTRLYLSIKDFLAQKFGVAVLQNPDFQDQLIALFEKITNKENQGSTDDKILAIVPSVDTWFRSEFLRARREQTDAAMRSAAPNEHVVDCGDDIACDFCNAEIVDEKVILVEIRNARYLQALLFKTLQ